MTVAAEHEQPRTSTGAGFSDAVTFSFGDQVADAYGVARIGLSTADDGSTSASGLAIVFAGHEPVAVSADGGVAVDEPTWEAIDAAGVRTRVLEPLSRWTVSLAEQGGGAALELEFAAVSAPAELEPDAAVARAGGMEGYEQLCRVTGSLTVEGASRPIDCLGQRGHSWGAPDWDRIELARSVSAWLDTDLGVSLTAIRPAAAKAHGDELLGAFLWQPGGEEQPAIAALVADPRLSTTSDTDGRQRRAGLELFVGEDDDHARRAAGEVVCGTSLDLGRLRLDCAFFEWRMEGRSGVGRYDIIRRV